MKKLLNILGAVSLTAIGTSSVVACKPKQVETTPVDKTKPEETKTTKETKPEEPKPVVVTKPYKQNLSKLIKITNLGEITMSGGNPTVAELEAAIKAKNDMYQNGDATFANITETGAKATGTKAKYTGTVELSYTKKVKIININGTNIGSHNGKSLSNKINLNTINKLTLNIIAEENKKIYNLDSKITNAEEFKNKPLGEKYEINYYADNGDNKNDISTYQQLKNYYFYVVIKAKKNNPNYEGETKKIEVRLY